MIHPIQIMTTCNKTDQLPGVPKKVPFSKLIRLLKGTFFWDTWYVLVKYPYELGHMGGHYGPDPKNVSKFQ